MAVAVVQSVQEQGSSPWTPELTGVSSSSVLVLAFYNQEAGAYSATYDVSVTEFGLEASLDVWDDADGGVFVWVATGLSGTVSPDITQSGGGGENGSAILIEISGADTTTPLDVTPTSDNQNFSNPYVIPSIDPVTADCLHIALQGGKNTDPSDDTGPSGYTALATIPSGDRGLSAFYKVLSGSAATGALNSNNPGSVSWWAMSLAIRPASGGGGTAVKDMIGGGFIPFAR